MLKKIHRLSKNEDFKKALSRGKIVNSRDLALKYIKNQLPYPRFGIIVSTKISKKTVLRNKLKRRLREIIKKLLSPSISGYNLILLPRKSALKKNYQELFDQTQKLFQQIETKK